MILANYNNNCRKDVSTGTIIMVVTNMFLNGFEFLFTGKLMPDSLNLV